MSPEAEPLDLFLRDVPARIGRLARSELEQAVPAIYKPAAASVARQATGGWTLVLSEDEGFAVDTAMRELRLARSFGAQCARVMAMVTGSRNPELLSALAPLGAADTVRVAVMAAFFHYFVAHEFVHVEQGLGSDQYKDSDSYMPIVMEADHHADIAGLVIAATAGVPELETMDQRDRVLLLTAIHVAAMQSFDTSGGTALDAYAFSRLLVWHLHFARFCKAASAPEFGSPTFSGGWTVTLPRLVGRNDQRVTVEGLRRRHRKRYPANSDIVLAYQHEDGLYRIHRAALTDGARVWRLAVAIVEGRFDDVRIEFEEVLVNNPALVPQARLSPDVEWAAGAVIDALYDIEDSEVGEPPDAGRIAAVRTAYGRLRVAARAANAPAGVQALLDRGDWLLDGLEAAATDGPALNRLRRMALSVVDQIAVAVG